MELRQLEYFVAVAEEANFTRAAERVHISQSGVSAQIRALEAHLGTPLFDRSARTARLTAAGAAALPHARAALDAATAVRRSVDEISGVLRGRLTVGMITGCEVTPLFDALAAFHRDHPGIEIALHEDNSDRLVEHTRAGTVDIALVGVAGEPPPGLDTHVVISEGLVAAVPPDHPLARRARATLAQLTAYPIVSLPLGTGIRGVFDQACAAAGVRPRIALQATAPGAVADLAVRGLGVAVLSASMARAHAELRAVPLRDVRIPALLALVWRPAAGPALRALLPHCRAAFPPGPH
ncbi:LysR family transcriptional regulator [Jidongwangia harbinensis]|uniref:LysR family transcriptional regulator n=1 Tax=Jidongwangia harbinensis TaxID=2878561 RepID=UPI001CDA37C2|nr:LysR family transcriptional regulator [Jidongwangia harbinensis]MCA2213098.1 LysR family transcriptional regulator [Jidongwangia harbinensis]